MGERSIVMTVSVCLSVRQHIFRTTRPILANFLYVLPMSVARSSSGGVAMRCTSGFMYDVMFVPNDEV